MAADFLGDYCTDRHLEVLGDLIALLAMFGFQGFVVAVVVVLVLVVFLVDLADNGAYFLVPAEVVVVVVVIDTGLAVVLESQLSPEAFKRAPIKKSVSVLRGLFVKNINLSNL